MPLSRRAFIRNTSLLTAGLLTHRHLQAAQSPRSSRQPNFIIVFCDDLGYADVGCFDAQGFKTPNLDRLAAQGMKFTDFYAAAPVCSASRAALMTGCYPARVGITGVLFPEQKPRIGLSPSEITIARLLKQAGYATACVGKWHLGHTPPFLPIHHGFDSYFGIPYSNDMSIDPGVTIAPNATLRQGMTLERIRSEKPKQNWVPLMRQDEVIEYPADQTQLTRRYTQEATRFIAANKDKPFFLYLAHSMPHVPLFASPQFRGSSQHGLYGDVIQEIDWSVGQILQTLQELNLDDNTLLIFTSDNGPWLEKNNAAGHAVPLRDGKFTRYEGGFREPCLMRWPGQIPAGKACSEIASTIDLLPTFATLAGVSVPSDCVIDGKNIWPLMNATPSAHTPHDAFFYEKSAVRSGNWKLYKPGKYQETARDSQGKYHNRDVEYPKPRLYDLAHDISETTDLADQHPDIVQRLSQLLADHVADLKAHSRPVGTIAPKS
ncbi:MAG TPA: sulfatase, partial [Tepidisphaeraceae bacterium]|nr:sulfatase [Tepidisphaeraceae bacterium]